MRLWVKVWKWQEHWPSPNYNNPTVCATIRVQTVLDYRNSNLNKLTSNTYPLGKEPMAEEVPGSVTGTLSQGFITKQCSPHPVSAKWNREIKNPLKTKSVQRVHSRVHRVKRKPFWVCSLRGYFPKFCLLVVKVARRKGGELLQTCTEQFIGGSVCQLGFCHSWTVKSWLGSCLSVWHYWFFLG